MDGAAGRRERILSQLISAHGPELDLDHVCAVAAEVTRMSGAGIMLMSGDIPRGSLCTTNSVSDLIERLQFDLGEGPCVDAYQYDRPVLEPDLAHPEIPRWVAFSGPAVRGGARAIFGFPLRVGSIRLGALNLYRDRPGALSDDQYADADVMSDITAQAVLLLQANASPGQLAAELETTSDFQAIVHQASGMLAVQLGIGVGQAFIRLRARAFGDGRPLTDVAKDVVSRKVRFDEDDGRGSGSSQPVPEDDH